MPLNKETEPNLMVDNSMALTYCFLIHTHTHTYIYIYIYTQIIFKQIYLTHKWDPHTDYPCES